MKYFKLLLILLFAMVAAAPIYAADTGLFYDAERDGEGLLVMRDERLIVTYFFTYGASSCDEDYKPDVGPLLPEFYDCGNQGQRWFFTSDKWNGEDMEATGFIFMASGVDYPKGIPDVTNPFVQIVGEAIPVGVYILRPAGDGYQMLVVPYGDRLDKDDPLYNRIYQFTTLLFEPLGVSPR